MTVAASNLVELGERAIQQHAALPAFGTRAADGFTWLSYGAWGEAVAACRAGLAGLGVGPGDRVSIVANNRVEWAVVAYATYGRGAALVPMYEAQRAEEWRYVLADSGARVVIAGRPDIATALRAQQAGLASLEHVLSLEAPAADPSSY
ncbi:MAG TPA: AMP-binding protein, partial [Polyangiaceae bacterium]|nr:AMP-binding protein [Polyangiaceae bacterium]